MCPVNGTKCKLNLMKFRTISKWDEPDKSVGLMYFAQLVEEMLFDFSLDTYKASVMNTSLLCYEALETLKQVERGNIKPPNILHVTAELCATFEKDPVAQALVAIPYRSFVPTLKNPKTPLKELENVLELLAVQLSLSKYRKKNEDLLIQEIRGGQSFQEIRRLARSYITTLIASGFSQKHIRDIVLDFFHFGENRIGGADAIKDFIEQFSNDKTEFTVVFRVEKVFESVADAFSALGLTVTKSLPAEIDLSAYHSFTSVGGQCIYGVVSKVPAKDMHSARMMAERLLKLCSTFLRLFHHKQDAAWSTDCVVVNTKDNSHKKIAAPTNSMHKCSDLIQSVASKRLQLFMTDFSLELDSFSKFIRSAQLHSMALDSNADENQILNLWISLESLVPSETKADDASNIEHIVSSLMPFLCVGYIDRLLNNLVKDLLRWNSVATRNALRAVPGKKFTDKLAKVLALPDFEKERGQIEATFLEFHLLRDRFSYFQTVLSSPAAVLTALDAHRIRLEWQIRRIYRTRNIIVHSGETPNYTRPLIEHTHDYLDSVLSSLVGFASSPKVIHSVGQGFKFVELKYSNYINSLSEKALAFDAHNMDSLLFNR